MKNNNVKHRDPFNGPLSAKANTVGGTYGARREIHRTGGFQQKAAITKPADKYTRANAPKKHVPLFKASSRARYSEGRRLTAGSPHKKPLHHRLEQGTLPNKKFSTDVKASQANVAKKVVKKPSDRAILNYLDKVRAMPSTKRQAQKNTSA